MPAPVDLTQPQSIHSSDPGALQQVIEELSGDMLDDLAGPLLSSGLDLWRGLAVFLVAWTGLRMALGGWRGSEVVRLLVAISVPRMMLHYYDTPLPGTTMNLPAVLVGGGNWIAAQVSGDSWSSTWEWLASFWTRAWEEAKEPFSQGGVTALLLGLPGFGGDLLAAVLAAVCAIFMALVALLLVLVCYAQVLWAQFALGIAAVLGPVFIPFLLFDPLAFLFWGWLRTMITYSLYAAVAACVLRVFLGAAQVATNQIWLHVRPDLGSLGEALLWILSYIVLALAGVLAALKVPELSSSLVSGSAGGGGMLGALVSVASAGQVALKGGNVLRGGR